jgi:DNA helicase-2/ATP-dependent DNA helicase PcrA
MSNELDTLSEIQKKAVQHKDGPLMVVAGPGSGKTRVIANRIAHLINHHQVAPERILAVTFTNKAADEMRERCNALTKEKNGANVSTFHSLCVLLLRNYGKHINVEPNFSIYDDGDQMRLIKRILKDMDKDLKSLPYKISTLIGEISVAKNNKLTPSQYVEEGMNPEGATFTQSVFEIFDRYEKLLKFSNSLDFDDLLLKTAILLENFEEVRDEIEDRYHYLLVDEFQDTNKLQLDISKNLQLKRKNLFVVGDPDQSVYSWRHAEPKNLMDFGKLFPEAEIVKLDQNYRSTKSIITVADKLISNNKERFERELWTDNEQGNDVVLITARNPKSESEFVTRELNFLVKKGISPEEIAVMYRVNAQSRSMEDRLEELKIPYRLIGALGFRERREVKDVLAYLSILINPYDENSLARIINTPRRGISDATYDLIRRGFLDQTEYESVVEYIRSKPWKSDILLNKRAVTSLEKFLDLLEGLQAKVKVLSPENLISEVIKSSEYGKYLEDDPDYENRVRNVEELKIKARETSLDITDPFFRTVDFVQKFALVTKIDDPTIVGVQEDENAEKITLITLHQAKGLEYSVVFIIGFEQGMLPHSRSLDSFDEMEEERRLCYVGMTRAKERLYLTNCLQRVSWNDMGKNMFSQAQMPSQFLNEIPENLLKTADYTSSGSITYTNRKFKASDYEKPPSKRKAFSPNFSPSDVVRHKIFGRGIVVSVNKEHEEEEILVKFDELDETKLILPAFGSIHKEQSQNDEDPSEDFDFLGDWSGASRKNLPKDDGDFSDYFKD